MPTLPTMAEVQDAAELCGWFSFEAATRWFNNIAWDIGLVVIRPNRTSLAVLAATDTD
jgi:hypothetical protein